MGAGSHVLPCWLSTLLAMGVMAYVIASSTIGKEIPRGDKNVPFPENKKKTRPKSDARTHTENLV